MKIVVTGVVQSGKSSYVKYFDQDALNVQTKGIDEKEYTVGMDMTTLKIREFDIFLFGTPGLARFSVIRDVIIKGADGIIFFFDAADPSKDVEAISMLNSIRARLDNAIPIIYIANKQDLEDARPAEVIRAQNNFPEDAKFFSTSIKTSKDLDASLEYMIDLIFENYKEILILMQDYESDIKGLAEILKKNKHEIREFLNNLESKHFITLDRKNRIYSIRESIRNLI